MSRLENLYAQKSKLDAEIRFLEQSQCQTTEVTDKAYMGEQCGGQSVREKSPEEIINDLFTYHPVETSEQELRYQVVRDAAKHLALVIWKNCPYGRDRTNAIDTLRMSVMLANASIANHGVAY